MWWTLPTACSATASMPSATFCSRTAAWPRMEVCNSRVCWHASTHVRGRPLQSLFSEVYWSLLISRHQVEAALVYMTHKHLRVPPRADYSDTRAVETINADLADTFGNVLSRCTSKVSAALSAVQCSAAAVLVVFPLQVFVACQRLLCWFALQLSSFFASNCRMPLTDHSPQWATLQKVNKEQVWPDTSVATFDDTDRALLARVRALPGMGDSAIRPWLSHPRHRASHVAVPWPLSLSGWRVRPHATAHGPDVDSFPFGVRRDGRPPLPQRGLWQRHTDHHGHPLRGVCLCACACAL